MSEHLYALRNAWEDDLRRQKKPTDPLSAPWRPPYLYSSKIRLCARASALDMLHPEDDPFGEPLQIERLEQGNETENAVIARLHRIGRFCKPAFRITEQQIRMEIKDRDGTVLIVGKIDGRMTFEDGTRPLFDVKAGKSYDGCQSIEDLDSGVWSRTAIDQMLTYLYADERQTDPRWGFILVRNFSAFPTFIRINLDDHMERLEQILKRARSAVDARHQRSALPDFIDKPSECRRCPHLGKSCSPPMDYGEGMRVITDPEIIALVETVEQNKMGKREYERAHKKLMEEIRGVESVLIGNYRVTGHWERRTKYDIPEEVKAQYAAVEDKGAWNMEIEKLS